jgi:hypothetical protein
MPVADIEHRQRLIDAYDPAAFQSLRHRPGDSTGTGRHVEDRFAAFQREHLGQSVGQIGADLRGPAIELRRMLRIMETGLVLVPMAMVVLVTVLVFVIVGMTVFVSMLMTMVVRMRMFVLVMSMAVIVFIFFFHTPPMSPL